MMAACLLELVLRVSKSNGRMIRFGVAVRCFSKVEVAVAAIVVVVVVVVVVMVSYSQ